MALNVAAGVTAPQAPLGAGGSEIPPLHKSHAADDARAAVPAYHSSDAGAGHAEEKRFEAIQQASHDFFRDVYAVSDTTFTIYKDESGQYITRYTSLRDGKVTYVPENNILQYAQSRAHGSTSFIEIQV